MTGIILFSKKKSFDLCHTITSDNKENSKISYKIEIVALFFLETMKSFSLSLQTL